MKVKEESEKLASNSALKKKNKKKPKIITSPPITSWQIDGGKMETVADFIFLGSEMTTAMKLKDSCSLKGKLRQTQCSRQVTSVMSNSLRPHGLQPARRLCPWGSPPGQNTGVGCHALLQGIFLTRGLKPSPTLANGFFTTSTTRKAQILKSRDITLLTKTHMVKVMFLPVVMYIREIQITQKAVLKN